MTVLHGFLLSFWTLRNVQAVLLSLLGGLVLWQVFSIGQAVMALQQMDRTIAAVQTDTLDSAPRPEKKEGEEKKEESHLRPIFRNDGPKYILSGICMGKAIINGQIVKAGESVERAKVVRVESDKAVIREGEKEITLRLFENFNKPEAEKKTEGKGSALSPGIPQTQAEMQKQQAEESRESKTTEESQGSEEEPEEVEMDISDVPDRVRDVIEAQLGKGYLGDIEMEQEDGETVYDVELEVDGMEVDLEIGEDGEVRDREEEEI